MTRYDVIVIGGGYAGLAAATYVARARRTVRVIDAGQPRNRFAARAHGYLSRDGDEASAILADARRQLTNYPTASITVGEVTSARSDGTEFVVTTSDGEASRARKLVLAFGLADRLPALAGLQERWGISVLHCPYCHGIEFADRPLGIFYDAPLSVHQAMMVAEWGPATLFVNGAGRLSEDDHAMLAKRGVKVEPGVIRQLEGDDRSLTAVLLEDGRRIDAAAFYLAPASVFGSPLAKHLGCAIDNGPFGPVIRTGDDRMTTTPGVYAAGDIVRAPHSIAWAVADGVTAGIAAHRALVFG